MSHNVFDLQMQQKSVCALPYVLSLNCQLESEADREFWRAQQASCPAPSSWVPLTMEVSLEEGRGMSVREVPPEESEEDPTCTKVLLLTVSPTKGTLTLWGQCALAVTQSCIRRVGPRY